MKRMTVTLLGLLLWSMIVAGCWSRRELNDLAITVAMGIDKAENGQYRVSTQLVNPGEVAARKGSSSKGAPVVTYTGTGETVFEALRKITTKSPRKLYLSHLRMLIVSESLAREGIGKVLDVLSRAHELRTDFFIVVARGESALKMLDVYTVPQEIIPANHMFKSIDTSSTLWAAAGKKTIDELISNISSKGKEPVLTGITIKGDTDKQIGTVANVQNIKPHSILQVSGLAVFKDDKLISWLNEDESKAYNYILGKVKGTAGHIACPKGGKLALEVIRTKSTIKGKAPGGKPEAEVKLHLENDVTDVECEIDLMDIDTIRELENRSEKRIKQMLEKTIANAQNKWHADIFGFGEAIHRSAPKEWKKMEHQWERLFTDLPVKVNVDVKIRRLGTVSDPFMNQMKE